MRNVFLLGLLLANSVALGAYADPKRDPGSYVTSGTIHGLTILIDFQDDQAVAAIDASAISALMTQPGYAGFGNGGSVRDFYLAASNGRCDYFCPVAALDSAHNNAGGAFGYYRAPGNKAAYSVSHEDAFRAVITDALTALESQGFDFATLSTDSQQNVLALNVLYANTDAGTAGPACQSLHPSTTPFFSADGVHIQWYEVSVVNHSPAVNPTRTPEIGTICHESGHMFCGWMDMDDRRPPFGFGDGVFCLMTGFDTSSGKRPPFPSAFLRARQGWIDILDVAADTLPQEVQLNASRTLCYRYRNPAYPQEYFLIEARDSAESGGGGYGYALAIWHIDELMDANGYSDNTPALHYQCALVQADGLFDLETSTNVGEQKDLFFRETRARFDDDTSPAAHWWNGTDSHLALGNISSLSPILRFTLNPLVLNAGTTVRGVVGVPFSYPLQTRGGVAVDLAVDDLPPGLTLTGGVISGTPQAAGTTAVTVRALSGGHLYRYPQTLTVAAAAVPQIDGPLTVAAALARFFAYDITATGANTDASPMTYSCTNGPTPPNNTLPASVTFTNGHFSGRFTGSTKTYNLTVTATNAAGSDSRTLTIDVTGSAVPAITNGPPPATGTVGTPYDFAYSWTGNPAPVFAVTSGALPPGLTLSNTGVISGVPTVGGSYSGIVMAGNVMPTVATQAFSIVIPAAPPVAPSHPAAVIPSATSIRWSWCDESSNETGFLVYAGAGAAAPDTVTDTTAANAVAWSCTGLSPNTQYAFQVAATGVGGDSAKTANLAVFTLANAPAAPVLGVPTATSLSVAIDGGDGNPAGTAYALRCVTTGQWVQADGVLGATTVWQTSAAWDALVVRGLTPGTDYLFVAQARNGDLVATGLGPTAGAATLRQDQVITFAALSDMTYGDAPVTLSATASSGLAVSLSVLDGPATLADNTLTITGVGTVTVRASQAGDHLWKPAADVDRRFAIAKFTPVLSWARPADITYGTALSGTQLNATAGGVSGSFAYSPAAGTRLGAGRAQALHVSFTPTHPETCEAVAGSVPLTVLKAALSVTADHQARAYAAANPAFTATYVGFVEGEDAASLGGMLTFTCVADAASPPGEYPIIPDGLTSDNYDITFIDGSLTVAAAAQTIRFAALPYKAVGDADFAPGAVASSGLPVSYASFNPAVATLVGGLIHIVGPGTTVITASQGGTGQWAPAAPVSRVLQVLLAPVGGGLAWGAVGPAVPPGLAGVKALAKGGNFTVALKADGSVVAWGQNYNGECNVPADLAGVTAIAAGYVHTLALKSDGTVVAWGWNYYGQCSVPAGLTDVTAVAVGAAHSVALKRDGTVVVWGETDLGQCAIPAGLTQVKAIVAGDNATAALKTDGTVVAWGLNDFGQCTVPDGLTKVKAVAVGAYHMLALRDDGTVVVWGMTWNGGGAVPAQLADVATIVANGMLSAALKSDGTVAVWGVDWTGQSTVPEGLTGVTALSLGAYHVAAVRSDGTVVAWGQNEAAQCAVPAGLAGVTAVAAGLANTVALKDDGTVVSWGDYDHGQCALPADLSGVLAVAAGDGHTLVLEANGTVAAWGWNDSGQCGVPDGLCGVNAIAAGATHSLALQTAGTVVAWGANDHGQCTPPPALMDVIAIAAGVFHSVALKGDGTVVAWGNNDALQCAVPAGLTGVVAIAAGSYHTAALKDNGMVVAWGDDSSWQCEVPPELNGVVAIAAGTWHTVALKADGSVAAWGDNDFFGECDIPAGLTGVLAISAAAFHTVALKRGGAVIGWGDNAYAQCTPPAGLAGAVALATGAYHTVALLEQPLPATYRLALHAGWNLISLPLEPLDPLVTAIFGPDLAPVLVGGVWAWTNGGYQNVTELHTQRGYWLYALAGASVPVSGAAASGRVDLQAGWNLLGPSATVATSALSSPLDPASIWGWGGAAYQAVTELQPGAGYWLFATEAASEYRLGP